jgi:hypothetical protein
MESKGAAGRLVRLTKTALDPRQPWPFTKVKPAKRVKKQDELRAIPPALF